MCVNFRYYEPEVPVVKGYLAPIASKYSKYKWRYICKVECTSICHQRVRIGTRSGSGLQTVYEESCSRHTFIG